MHATRARVISSGVPMLYYRGQCADTYTQVMNTAFPAGLISVKAAANAMDAACLKAK